MERKPRSGGRQERKREIQLENGQVLYGSRVKQDMAGADRSEKVYDGSEPTARIQIYDSPGFDEQDTHPPRHSVLWGMTALVCLLLLVLVSLALMPQLFGIRFRFLPNIAFAGAGVIEMDESRMAVYRQKTSEVYTDTIYPGVSIDGLDVSGMTVDEARARLMDIPAAIGSEFAITVQVSGQTWVIDSNHVPMTRDTEDQLMLAYAQGRTQGTDGSGTPMEKRLQAIESLKMNPVQLSTTLSFDSDRIREMVSEIAAQVEKPAENAYVAAFDVSTRTFYFGEDVSGAHLDADRLYTKIMRLLENENWYGVVSMEPETVVAQMTKAELMNQFRKISSYTTSTTNNANRNTNIRLSCEAINGMMVGSGDIFSFNQATGERTAVKGYKPATAISGGQNIEEVGGGVCQTSSTLFNAVARANLEIVTRSPHAWPSNYVEKGMDATVNWPGLDFQFRNDTDWPIYIVASYANRKVTVEIYGMSLGDGLTIDLQSKVIKTLQAPSGVNEVRNESLRPGTRKTTVKARKGYVVETYQVWYQNGQEIKRELLCTSTYKAYQETVEYN